MIVVTDLLAELCCLENRDMKTAFHAKDDIMRRHPLFLFGWLLAATVLLSLVGLTAKPLPAADIDMIDVKLEILNS